MSISTLQPKTFSQSTQEFLFACAFWIMAADEELKGLEQDWLVDQFGDQQAMTWLEKYMQMGGEEFVQHFDNLAEAVPVEEREKLYPVLKPWLGACVTSDGEWKPAENEVMLKIQDRIDFEESWRPQEEQPAPGETAPTEQLSAEAPAEDVAELSDGDDVARKDAEAEAGTEDEELSLKERVRKIAYEGTAQDEKPADEVRTFEGHTEEVTALALAADETFVVSVSQDRTARVWDTPSGDERYIFKGHQQPLTSVICAAEGDVISLDRAGGLIRWSPEDGTVKWQAVVNGMGGGGALAASADRAILTLATMAGDLLRIDAANGRTTTIRERSKGGALRCAACSPDGKYVAIGGDNHEMHLVEIVSGRIVATGTGHSSSVMGISLGQLGKQVATCSRDNTVRLWDAADGTCLHIFDEHTFSVYDVDLDDDRHLVVSCSWDHSVRAWSIETGDMVLNHQSIDGRFNAAVVCKRSDEVFIACSDGTVYGVKLPA
jgi:hypothetical protein